MKALQKMQEGIGFVQLNEIEEPKPKIGQIKILVKSAGICGTDIKILEGNNWCNPPVTMGHEYSGIVEEVGEDITSVKVGDRVVSETAQIICGHCFYCKTGNELMCPARLSIGYGTNGAFANYIIVREAIVHKLPDNVTFDESSLCEPAAVAIHAVYDKMKLIPTDTVLVMGPGTIGLLVAQVIKNCGCRVIIAGMPADEQRLKVAKELGIDYTINCGEVNMVETVMELTDGKGVEYAYDCTGASVAINNALHCLKACGSMVQIGLTKPNIGIDYSLLPQKQLSIIGTFGHKWKGWEIVLKLLQQKKLRVEPMITHRFTLDEWEEAFNIAQKGQGIKIIIHPNGND